MITRDTPYYTIKLLLNDIILYIKYVYCPTCSGL